MCAGEHDDTDEHGRTRTITDDLCSCWSVSVHVRPCSCEKLGTMRGGTTETRTWKVQAGHAEARSDHLATEEPLEIRLAWDGGERIVAVTMRTPGNDEELAAGFLFAEGVIDRRELIV